MTIEVHGDNVELDDEHKTMAVHGHVTVTAATDRPGYPTASLVAEEVEGDLRAGRLVATKGVKLRSQQLALRGQRADIDLKQDEFTLDQGGMQVDVESPRAAGRLLRGFFFGDKMGRQGRVLYVIHGSLTTCDRAHPHYSIGASKITYDTATDTLDVYRGRLQLQQFDLQLPGHISHRLGGAVADNSLGLPLPGYSSFDGLYGDFIHSFGGPEAPWQFLGTLRVGTELQFPYSLVATHAHEEDVFTARLTRFEQVVWNLRERSRLSRLPDLTYVHHLQPNSAGLPRLEFTAFAGYLHEHVEDGPLIEASRGGLELDYTPFPWQRRNRRGVWWAATGRQTFYDTGQQLRNLQVELGTGWIFSDRFSASLSGMHQFTSGESPFFFDRPWVEDELDGTLEAGLTADWRLNLTGRWDLDRSQLRDYTVKLSRRVHCLTWNIGYNYGAELFTVGLDLNGMTGNTVPPVATPLVAPDEVPPLPQMIPGEASQPPPLRQLWGAPTP